MTREPVVAGTFYPESEASLRREISSMLVPAADTKNAIGAVSPHAGYIYSGPVACKTLSSISKIKDVFVILGTNHTGLGNIFGIDPNRAWRTPLGDVKIDDDLALAISRNGDCIAVDGMSHFREHSIEVQLPILQSLRKEMKIVPITVSHSDLAQYRKAATAIADAIKSLGMAKRTTIIASSDFTHYEDLKSAEKKDSSAISAIIDMDEEKLLRSVSDLNISMCGTAPVSVMIIAAKLLGARKAELIGYSTSADATADSSSVVGYAGIILS